MKTALLTGILVLLFLAAPTGTFALGMAEYGQDVGGLDQPVPELSRLKDIRRLCSEWQARATYCLREVVPRCCRICQLLLAGIALASYWFNRLRRPKRSVIRANFSVGSPNFEHTQKRGSVSVGFPEAILVRTGTDAIHKICARHLPNTITQQPYLIYLIR